MVTKSDRKDISKIKYEKLFLMEYDSIYILSKSGRCIPLPFSDCKSKLIKQASEQSADSKQKVG